MPADSEISPVRVPKAYNERGRGKAEQSRLVPYLLCAPPSGLAELFRKSVPSENEGGPGLIASGVVMSAEGVARIPGIARQTPRVSVTIKRTGLVKRRLGRAELKAFAYWNDGRPETELNFKLYRQATNKIVGLSEEAAAFLGGFF